MSCRVGRIVKVFKNSEPIFLGFKGVKRLCFELYQGIYFGFYPYLGVTINASLNIALPFRYRIFTIWVQALSRGIHIEHIHNKFINARLNLLWSQAPSRVPNASTDYGLGFSYSLLSLKFSCSTRLD